MDEILRLLKSIDTRFKGLEDQLKLKAARAPKEVRWVYLDPKPVRASMLEKGWNQSDLARQLGVREKIKFQFGFQASNAFRSSVWLGCSSSSISYEPRIPPQG